jgi:hypothetical protein
MSKISLEALKLEMFDTIQRLKAGNDPNANPEDTISVDAAKQVQACGRIIVDAYRVQADVIRMACESDSKAAFSMTKESGLIDNH